MTLQRLIQIGFWSTLAVVSWFAFSPHPPQIAVGDKLQHGFAFMVLCIMMAIAYPRLRWFHLFLLLSVFGAVIELIQAIPALNRDSSFADWIADMVAIILALVMIGAVRVIYRQFRTPSIHS
ncbi:hypothetical protein AB1K62_03010 [Parasphingorhabdus sp. JC815]|uniref:hypothetical protein n=1 Tax=Parasphingorhabdus sp. JC815 TaxID=3232140 RepID=UPI003458A194